MSALAVFAFGEQMVRISDRDGEPWFVGRDVCAALAVKNSRDALRRLPEDEKGVVNVDTLGGDQSVTIISEPGMYRLVLTSRTEAAQRFKTWVVSDVLPAIRRTGKYAPVAANDAGCNEASMFEGGQTLASLAKLRAVTLAIRLYGDAHARDMWHRIGLPEIRTVPDLLRVRPPKVLPPAGSLHDQIVTANAAAGSKSGFDDDWRAK